jgi:DNA-binding MarR family transcriptional regulator
LSADVGERQPRSRDLLVLEFTELHWRLSLLIKASVTSQVEAASARLAALAASTTPHQRQAVVVLARRGGLSMSELARHLMISPSSATELVDRLVERGWVERQPDPGDRRAVVIRLSAKASRQADEVNQMLHAGVASLLLQLDDLELAGLVGLLRQLVGDDTERLGTVGQMAPPSGEAR